MDRRYRDPQVDALWSLRWQYKAWEEIERTVLARQAEMGIVDPQEAAQIVDGLRPTLGRGCVDEILRIEARTRHDVAAFLEWMRNWYGEKPGRWIHFGLTSSDLVDTTMGMRFQIADGILRDALGDLTAQLGVWMQDRSWVLGRTHGQPAEPIQIRMRAAHWNDHVQGALQNLATATQLMCVAKLSGPVGSFAHNPPELEIRVASDLGLLPQYVGASQVVPRTYLASWAQSAASLVHACAKIGVDLRLMHMLGEVWISQPSGQVGSSAMAHKTNPIEAEQLAGMSRLAAGYAGMLQQQDIWLEHDISHSSVERVAVPDLWHVLLHSVRTTADVLARYRIDVPRAELNVDGAGHLPFVARHTGALVAGSDSTQCAREAALSGEFKSELGLDVDWFARNYPDTGDDVT